MCIRINKGRLIAANMDGTIFTAIAAAIHICFHNGWHLLIMSIISLFNAFSRVADMKQMVNRRAYSKHNMLRIIEISQSKAAASQHFVKAVEEKEGRRKIYTSITNHPLQVHKSNQACKDLARIHPLESKPSLHFNLPF